MSTKIQGGSNVAGLANVDTQYNLNVNMPISASTSGFVTISCDIDPGTITGSRYVLSPEVSGDYRVRTGIDNMMFNELFPGSLINTTLWSMRLAPRSAPTPACCPAISSFGKCRATCGN